MEARTAKDAFPDMMENLIKAIEEKSDSIALILDTLINHLQETNNEKIDELQLIMYLKILLIWNSKEIVTKAAQTISELAKRDSGRVRCATSDLIPTLAKLLENSQDVPLLIQCCRALGNICYEFDEGRRLVTQAGCLPMVIHLLEKSLSGKDVINHTLRNVAAGFLLNLLIGQEDIHPKAIELGIMKILTQVLELDGLVESGEETSSHVLLILGLLTDSNGDILLDERLCQIAVRVLGASVSPEVSEMCLELLHGQAENETVKVHLAKAGLCQLLISLLEKHKPLVEDDEARNLMKMACDLIVLVLTGDESMNILYDEGRGQVFQSMVVWLTSDDEDLQITGVLAMGNFARTDKHCIQMVEAGVSKKLLTLVKKNNTPDGDIRLQHALLSALRNLVIPVQNKSTVLANGLVEAVLPMLAIPTFPVVFKLLGTLRMVIDGQEITARELGCNSELLQKLVEWCNTEDHPGVQGEANRLLAWLIKNSRDQRVITEIIKAKGISCLVKMVTAEHAVMQNEALLSLILLTAMRLDDATEPLIDANIGDSVARLLTIFGESLAPEVICNVTKLIQQLIVSETLKKHLLESNIKDALNFLKLKEKLPTTHEQVNQLLLELDAG